MPNKEPPVEHQFKPGVSGNPAGKPKGARSLKTLLAEALVKIGEGNAEPYDVLLIKRVMKMAIADGNEAMIKLVWSYIDGNPVSRTETDLTSGGEPINKIDRDNLELIAQEVANKLKATKLE